MGQNIFKNVFNLLKGCVQERSISIPTKKITNFILKYFNNAMVYLQNAPYSTDTTGVKLKCLASKGILGFSNH